jgi:Arc/MetJ family transcription regulator
MHIQTTIDDQLFQQAAKLTGLADKQALLEEALRLLIQARKVSAEAKQDTAHSGKRYQTMRVRHRVIPPREELYER